MAGAYQRLDRRVTWTKKDMANTGTFGMEITRPLLVDKLQVRTN